MYLYGASGHAKVIMDILRENGIEVKALIDDNTEVNELQGKTVFHSFSGESPLILSIGSNRVRKILDRRLDTLFATAISQSAIVSPSSVVGEGSVVMQGAILQTEVKVGRHCIVNTGASVDHECQIGDFVHLSPHSTICGGSEIGEGTWIGAGAVVIQCVKVGKWCVIGAGSVVINDLPDGVLAVGNPARIIRKID